MNKVLCGIVFLLWGCLLSFGGGCSNNAAECTNDQSISSTTIDTNGSTCKSDCDCNNQKSEGYCIGTRCISFAREGCSTPGKFDPCQPQPQFASVLPKNCTQWSKVCRATGLTSNVWGNCTCQSTSAEVGGQEKAADAGTPEEPTGESSQCPALSGGVCSSDAECCGSNTCKTLPNTRKHCTCATPGDDAACPQGLKCCQTPDGAVCLPGQNGACPTPPDGATGERPRDGGSPEMAEPMTEPMAESGPEPEPMTEPVQEQGGQCAAITGGQCTGDSQCCGSNTCKSLRNNRKHCSCATAGTDTDCPQGLKCCQTPDGSICLPPQNGACPTPPDGMMSEMPRDAGAPESGPEPEPMTEPVQEQGGQCASIGGGLCTGDSQCCGSNTCITLPSGNKHCTCATAGDDSDCPQGLKCCPGPQPTCLPPLNGACPARPDGRPPRDGGPP